PDLAAVLGPRLARALAADPDSGKWPGAFEHGVAARHQHCAVRVGGIACNDVGRARYRAAAGNRQRALFDTDAARAAPASGQREGASADLAEPAATFQAGADADGVTGAVDESSVGAHDGRA